jgi:hypothetical protein
MLHAAGWAFAATAAAATTATATLAAVPAAMEHLSSCLNNMEMGATMEEEQEGEVLLLQLMMLGFCLELLQEDGGQEGKLRVLL